MLAALLSALFASCKDEIEEDLESYKAKADKGAISFSTYTSGATRAAEVNSEVLKGNVTGREGGFHVLAWYDGSLYFNETAGYTETTGGSDIFDTQKETYYWPILSTTKRIDFRAFNVESEGKWTGYQNNSIEFPIKDKASDQKDLVAAIAYATQRPEGGVQPLNFNHALSKINFTFRGAEEGFKYIVNKVEIIAAKKTQRGGNPVCNLQINNPTLTSAANSFSWDVDPIADNISKLVKTGGLPDNDNWGIFTYYDEAKGIEAGELNEDLMLVPQRGKIVIRVYYKVEDDGRLKGNCGYEKTDAAGRHESQYGYDPTNRAMRGCKTVVVDLGTEGIPEWEAGKSYRYTLTLPTSNFVGDTDKDGVADDRDNDKDLDGDGDGNQTEFKVSKPILFSVKVTSWNNLSYNGNITIIN